MKSHKDQNEHVNGWRKKMQFDMVTCMMMKKNTFNEICCERGMTTV